MPLLSLGELVPGVLVSSRYLYSDSGKVFVFRLVYSIAWANPDSSLNAKITVVVFWRSPVMKMDWQLFYPMRLHTQSPITLLSG